MRQLMQIMTFLVGISLLSGALVGCSIPSKEDGSAHSQQVVIPWWSKGTYKWEAITLFSMKNLSELDGTAAKFFLSPSAKGKSLIGTQPRVRSFINKNGSAVLTDELSQHMVTLYAHLEKLQEMDERLGLGAVLNKPRVVGVNVLQTDGASNNALYSPKYDALLFLPYRGRDLPIIVNAGAVAHEHFHALFQALVAKDIQNKVDTMALVSHPEEKEIPAAFGLDDEEKIITELEERSRYHSFLLRAINEGLADVWGWIYTGDTNFIQKTWPKLNERNMSAGTGPIAAREIIRAQSLQATERGKEDVSQAYALGTSYARLIRAVYDKPGMKEDLGNQIILLLSDLKKEILELSDEAWLSPSIVPALLSKKTNSKSDCELLLSFAVAAEIDSAKFNCSRFERNPSSESNPVIAMMGYGVDARAERDQEQSTLARSWHSVVIGAGYKPWMASFEYATFSESSGNDTLSVARKTETALLWFQWHTMDQWAFRPYIGMALGGYREGTDSTFYSDVREDQSAWTEHLSGALGLRWAEVTPVWVSLEGRVHSNKYLDPSPMLSGLLRIGFVIE